MRRIELNKIKCSERGTNRWCFLMDHHGDCILDEQARKRNVHWTKTPNRFDFCRHEFPNNIIVIEAG